MAVNTKNQSQSHSESFLVNKVYWAEHCKEPGVGGCKHHMYCIVISCILN